MTREAYQSRGHVRFVCADGFSARDRPSRHADDRVLGPGRLGRRRGTGRERRSRRPDRPGLSQPAQDRGARGRRPADVVRMRTYAVGHTPDKLQAIGPAIADFFGDAAPAANTLVGVAALAAAGVPDRGRGDGACSIEACASRCHWSAPARGSAYDGARNLLRDTGRCAMEKCNHEGICEGGPHCSSAHRRWPGVGDRRRRGGARHAQDRPTSTTSTGWRRTKARAASRGSRAWSRRSARGNPHVLVTHGGDSISPSLLSGFDQGAHMIDLLNTIGIDAMAVGNHEFDFGPDVAGGADRRGAVPAAVQQRHGAGRQPDRRHDRIADGRCRRLQGRPVRPDHGEHRDQVLARARSPSPTRSRRPNRWRRSCARRAPTWWSRWPTPIGARTTS